MGAMQAELGLGPESGGLQGAGEEASPPDGERPAEAGDGGHAAAHAGADWNARFARLAEEHSRLLFRIAYGLLRNTHDADDAVQEALFRTYRAGLRESDGADGGEIHDEKAYLARIVWRAALDIAARRPKGTESLDAAEKDGESRRREFAAEGTSAEAQLAADDERQLLRRLIDGLPEEIRQPLVLSAIEEMTSREVAAALGIPEGTVRTRVMRARAELRKRFEAMRVRTRTAADAPG